MFVSIIIPTYNGVHRVQKLLKTLEKQTYESFEILVIIDGSTDNSYNILRKFKTPLKNLKIIYQENKGRSGARNRGIGESQGDLLLFLDDDMIPIPQFIEQHASFHKAEQDSILVGGCSHGNESDALVDIYRRNTEEKWLVDKDLNRETNIIPIGIENFYFTTQNLSIPRKIFDEIQIFDEELRDSEDFDLFMRLHKLSVPIFLDKRAFAYHEDYRSLESYISRQREYILARKQLAQKRPEYVKTHPLAFERVNKQIPPLKLFISRFFVYGPFWKFWLNLFHKSKLVPQNSLFRIIDIIIYASSTCYLYRNNKVSGAI